MNIMLWAVIKQEENYQQKKSTTTSMTPWGFLRKLFLLTHVRTVSQYLSNGAGVGPKQLQTSQGIV